MVMIAKEKKKIKYQFWTLDYMAKCCRVLHHVFTTGTWSFSNAHSTFADASEP
jgi:hypothetical protein